MNTFVITNYDSIVLSAHVVLDVVLLLVLVVLPQLRHLLQDGPDGPRHPLVRGGRTGIGAANARLTVSSSSAFASFLQAEQVEHLVGGHGLEAGVVRGDHRVGRLQLELLEAEDLLLDRVARDQTVDVYDLKKKEKKKRIFFLCRKVRPYQTFHKSPEILKSTFLN